VLFAQHGFEATSMAVIAREAEVGMSSIYVHFDSKAALVDALVQAALDREPVLDREAEVGRGIAAECAILGSRLLTFAEREPVAARALVAVASEPTVAGPNARQFLDMLVDRIEASVRSNAPKGADRMEVHATVALWLSILLGLVDQMVRRDGLAIQPNVAVAALRQAGRWANAAA
jgi:AcrR family transcriptional regulator